MRSRPRFLLPNRLSFLRIVIGIIIPWLLLWPTQEALRESATFWWALGLFVFAVFTDFWDGWLARRYRLETALGRILDPTADKVFILATMASFSAMGVYSYWYLVPFFFREVAITFCRLTWLGQGFAVGAERAGKMKLGCQVASVLFSFLYVAFPAPVFFYLNYAVFFLALFMTLLSAFFFFRHQQLLLTDKKFLRNVAGLGVGGLRPFPGTYGTLLGLLIVPLVSHDSLLHLLILAAFLVLAYVAIPRLGLAREEDPAEIVIDETCGILLAFVGIPVGWQALLTGFLLFRIFDVTKFFPIGWLEKREGVHGIVLDDLGAGVYTWLALKILFR